MFPDKGTPPAEYILLKYREKMHYTPKEVEEIDISVVLNDFTMWSIEAEVAKAKQEIEEDKQRTAEKNSQVS